MTQATSRDFASISTSGKDWRDVTRQLLVALEPLLQRESAFTIGFLYISDHLAGDAASILDLMRNVTGIEHWVGAVGLGVCANGADYLDVPAASVLVGTVPEDLFCVFPVSDITLTGASEVLAPWLDRHEAMLGLVHGDPLSDTDPMRILAALGHMTGGFIAGGLSASRRDHAVIAGQVASGGVGGVVFSVDIPVASALSQGCAPLGLQHVMTMTEGHVIKELDGRPAFDVFTDDIRALALLRAGETIDNDMIRRVLVAETGGTLPDDVRKLFRGEVHVAFPVTGSDRTDYMVRNILGVDPVTGWIAVPQPVHTGDMAMFVHRDDKTVRQDLIKTLLDLRERVIREHGHFSPRAGLYISCVARAVANFRDGVDEHPENTRKTIPGGEMALIQSVLGDLPLAGFYANGEISNQRLYGYTGVLILFL